MAQLSKSVGIILVLIVGFFIQVLFSFADIRDTPNKAVSEFSKAYFQIDQSMAERICAERLAPEGVDIVDKYIHNAAEEARERGFSISFMKNKLYDIKTEIISKNNNEAQIRITGKRRVSINPVYANVATIFNLSETHEVDEIINVVREDGKWKVCGDLYSLPAN